MFLVVDKLKGISSHAVVESIRKITGVKKVGHGGTLDPNATGLLIIAVSREYTKRLHTVLMGLDKTYIATVELGKNTDTFDIEGKVTQTFLVTNPPKRAKITQVLKSFIGPGTQNPPVYSALKVKGRKAYDLARSGKKVELQPRNVNIKTIDMVSYSYPKLVFTTTVSSGTYIRSLAFDIGQKLATGGYLTDLRRTAIGSIDIKEAVKVADLTSSNWQDYARVEL